MTSQLAPAQLAFIDRFIGLSRTASTTDSIEIGELADFFNAGKAAASASLDQLRKALQGSGDPDEVRIAKFGLGAVTDGNSVALLASLHELRSAGPDRRAAAAAKVVSQADAYRAFLKGSRLIALCEDNPYVSGVKIVEPLIAALDRITAAVNRL